MQNESGDTQNYSAIFSNLLIDLPHESFLQSCGRSHRNLFFQRMLRQFGAFLRMVEMDLLCTYGNHNVVGAIFSSQRIKAGDHVAFRHGEQIVKRCVIPKLLYGGNHAANTTGLQR